MTDAKTDWQTDGTTALNSDRQMGRQAETVREREREGGEREKVPPKLR